MSKRNGDKARFDRESKKKRLRRERSRELRKALSDQTKGAARAESPGK